MKRKFNPAGRGKQQKQIGHGADMEQQAPHKHLKTVNTKPGPQVPQSPLVDILLRATISPFALTLAVIYTRLLWAIRDLVANMEQLISTSKPLCTGVQTGIESLQYIPQLAIKSTAAAVNTTLTTAINTIANTSGLAIDLARTVVMQFASSQTRIWRCLVDMSLGATQGVLVSAVGDAQSAWNSGVQQFTQDIDKIIGTLNSQLETALGSLEFLDIFGGSSITNSVTIPRITDIFTGSLKIPSSVVESFQNAIVSIPTLGSLLDQLEDMIALPMKQLAAQVRAQTYQVLNNRKFISPPIPEYNWQLLATTSEWKLLSDCASGDLNAIAELSNTIRQSFAEVQHYIVIAMIVVWVCHVGLVMAIEVYRRRRNAQQSKVVRQEMQHEQTYPWISRHEGMAWRAHDPIAYHTTRVVLSGVRKVRGLNRTLHADSQPPPGLLHTSHDKQIAHRLKQILAYITHRATMYAILIALSSLLLIQIQLYVLNDPQLFIVPAHAAVNRVEMLVQNASLAFEQSLDTQYAHAVDVLTNFYQVASSEVSRELASPLIQSLLAINSTLSDASNILDQTVSELLEPVPILQNSVQSLVQCMLSGRLAFVGELANSIMNSVRIELVPDIQEIMSAIDQTKILARNHVKSHLHQASMTSSLTQTISLYKHGLLREQELAYGIIMISITPMAAGMGLMILQILMGLIIRAKRRIFSN